jgi:hypothetical protein
MSCNLLDLFYLKISFADFGPCRAFFRLRDLTFPLSIASFMSIIASREITDSLLFHCNKDLRLMLSRPRYKLVFCRRLLSPKARATFSSTSHSCSSPEFCENTRPHETESSIKGTVLLQTRPRPTERLVHFHPAGLFGQAYLSKTWLPSGGMTTAEEKKGTSPIIR